MAVDIRLYRSEDLLRQTSDGETDIERSKKAVAELAADASLRSDLSLLVDLRDTTGAPLGERELLSLGREFGRHKDAFSNKLAFLVPDLEQRVANANFIKACADIVGIELRAFVDADSALNWLSDV